MQESVEDIMREARRLIEQYGDDIPDDMMVRVFANMPRDIKETLGLVLAISAGMALLNKGKFIAYHSEAKQYLMITLSDQVPEGAPDGTFISLGNGEVDGYISNGVRVDSDGVTPPAARTCVVCGEESCTDPAQCQQRRNILAAVRGMGKAEPQSGLRNVEDTDG